MGLLRPSRPARERSGDIYVAPQYKLVWWRFRRHKLAVAGLVVLALIYLVAAFCEFWAPTTPDTYRATYSYAPPQRIHVSFDGGVHFFVYEYDSKANPQTLQREFVEDKSKPVALRFFARGEPYRLWGIIPTDIHLFGPVERGKPFYPIGADEQGRDLASRIIYGTRISMSVGLVGVFLSLLLGLLLGGISGYFGGVTDTVIQRIIEFVMSVPTLPLWLGLAAAVPPGWGPIKTYFAITVILSLIGWTGLARVIRSRFLQIRAEDYVLAAELDGVRRLRIINRHMLPAFTSHIIATLTLAIPSMILGETALSFLGLGLQPPVVSWGVLLQEAQSIRGLATAPWLLISGLAVVVAVVALNFTGDGLRDAADPYES
jgi:peptide/nickel transport system permease protein